MITAITTALLTQVTIEPSCAAIQALYQETHDGQSCCDGAYTAGSITCNAMQRTPSTHLRRPTGPYGVDSFYIGAEYTQVKVPRQFKVSDVAEQMAAMSFDTPPEVVIVGGVEYYGRHVNGSPVYLSTPVPMWAKVTVPSTEALKDRSMFQDVQSPWLEDSVEDAVLFFEDRMPWERDTNISSTFHAMSLATLWPVPGNNTMYQQLSALHADANASPVDVARALIFGIRDAFAPSTFRIAAWDALMTSSTVEGYKAGQGSRIWSKKHSYTTPAAPPPPAPVFSTGCVSATLTLNPGSYFSEVTLMFNNNTYGLIPPYASTATLCLTPGDSYAYEMMDSYGDGWN